jgi:hypothetical protein
MQVAVRTCNQVDLFFRGSIMKLPNYRWWPVWAVALASLSLSESGWAQEHSSKASDAGDADSGRFIRVTRDGQELLALQTTVVRYAKANDPQTTVDLVAAVHIGEGSYYQTLNELFRDYDAVLYELVAPEGTRVPEGGGNASGNPISLLQTSARNFLGLESQLQQIDYSRKNFRHADLSPADLKKRMQERGESAWSLALGTLTEMMNDSEMTRAMDGENAGLSLGEMMEMMGNPLKAKQFMARQMDSMGNLESGLGTRLTQLIVDDRNAAAMRVLETALEEGNRKVAIFYGAAHMRDFEERLAKQGFQQTSQSWITAWDLTRSHAARSTEGSAMSLLMRLMKEVDK